MSEEIKPKNSEELEQALQWALGNEVAVEVVGSGSKRSIGNPLETETVLDVSALTGVTLYEPEELVLSARVGTLRSEVEKQLTAKTQEFAFEPPDLSRLLRTNSSGTLGGMIASNLAGPRRIKAGAARDHFLGFSAVSGRGETFKSGGRVVKNVTGYDLCKVMAGSWGTLAVMSDVTFKVLPAAETQATVIVEGLDNANAMQAMSVAMQSECEVSAAAHIPADMVARSKITSVSKPANGATVLRLEGIASSVAYRAEKLTELLKPFGRLTTLDHRKSAKLWIEIRDVHYFCDDAGDDEKSVWRLSVPPMSGAEVARAIHQISACEVIFDWAGGLLWCAVASGKDAHARDIRGIIETTGGHATLIRAPHQVRQQVDVFQPLSVGLASLTTKLRESFDPKNILNPHRMHRE